VTKKLKNTKHNTISIQDYQPETLFALEIPIIADIHQIHGS